MKRDTYVCTQALLLTSLCGASRQLPAFYICIAACYARTTKTTATLVAAVAPLLEYQQAIFSYVPHQE